MRNPRAVMGGYGWAAVVAAGLLAGSLLGAATGVFAHGKSEAGAPPAVQPGRQGRTVFLDISVLGRKTRAADKMNELHARMAAEGYTVVSVAPYDENGDLQGFFLTYVK
ncbi:MAG: hypothetical protein ACOYXN_02405 [Acidobacteriota bacterium]